jgi:hypothetical protein
MFCELNSKSPYTGELESIWCSGGFFCDSVETKNYYCRVQMCNLHCFDIVEPDELIEQFAEIDDGIADLFLNDASPLHQATRYGDPRLDCLSEILASFLELCCAAATRWRQAVRTLRALQSV